MATYSSSAVHALLHLLGKHLLCFLLRENGSRKCCLSCRTGPGLRWQNSGKRPPWPPSLQPKRAANTSCMVGVQKEQENSVVKK